MRSHFDGNTPRVPDSSEAVAPEPAEEDGEGYAVESRAEWGETVGWIEHFDPDLAAGLSWADAFMRSPEALALFLEACGKSVLERAGEILEARVRTTASV